jgi:hypothetical protein
MSPVYRCVGFCVTHLTRSPEIRAHSLAFKTTVLLGQLTNTSLLHSGFLIIDWFL